MKRGKIIIGVAALLTFGTLTAAKACHYHQKNGEHCAPYTCGFTDGFHGNLNEEQR